MSMETQAPHPLDRPVWTALNSGWAHLAQGGADGLRLDPRYGPFAATADCGTAALAELAPLGGELWIVEAEAVEPPPGLVVVRTAALAQMVADRIRPLDSAAPIADLGEEDAGAMRALAALTQPGPFAELTHRLGDFVGVKEDGRLVAMAGERMRMPGLCEVSGVCTDPAQRGRGLAGALMSVVMRRIVARGETPFLHSYAGNATAIALYERLGFRIRRQMTVTILARGSGESP